MPSLQILYPAAIKTWWDILKYYESLWETLWANLKLKCNIYKYSHIFSQLKSLKLNHVHNIHDKTKIDPENENMQTKIKVLC